MYFLQVEIMIRIEILIYTDLVQNDFSRESRSMGILYEGLTDSWFSIIKVDMA